MDQLVANFVGAYFVAAIKTAPGALVEFWSTSEELHIALRIHARDEGGDRLLRIGRSVSTAEILEGIRRSSDALGAKYGDADGQQLAEQTKQAARSAEHARKRNEESARPTRGGR